MTLPYLTDSEINEICDPLTQSYAQRRFLLNLGILVKKKPNGRPLVSRAEFERAMMNNPAKASEIGAQPNPAAYLRLVNKERRNGTQTQRQ